MPETFPTAYRPPCPLRVPRPECVCEECGEDLLRGTLCQQCAAEAIVRCYQCGSPLNGVITDPEPRCFVCRRPHANP